MELFPEFGSDTEVVTELDLEWVCSHDPVFTLEQIFPVLDMYLEDALETMRFHLRSSDIKPVLMRWVECETGHTAAKAALAMHKGLWRDLLPRVGARDVLMSKYPFDRGVASWQAPGKFYVSVYEYFWRPSEVRRRRRLSARLPWEPHHSEHIMEAFDVLSAIAVNHNPKCLDRFPVLVRYIERHAQHVGMELGRKGVSRYWIEAALKPVRLIPMVAAVAVQHALWRGLLPVRCVLDSSEGPTLI